MLRNVTARLGGQVARGWPLLLALASPLWPAVAPAQPAGTGANGKPTVRLTLDESLRATLARSPEIRHSEADVELLRGKHLQALGLGYPQLNLVGGVGPSPRARGNQVSSPDDQYSPAVSSVFVRGGVELIQPLFTWGLITNARLAAEHGVRASQAAVETKSTEVALRVKQAYWGAVTARAILDFLIELRDQVVDAEARTVRLVEGGFATDVDVYRIQAGSALLEKGVSESTKTLGIAQAALGTWTGQPPGTLVEPADAALPSTVPPILAVEELARQALANRPELRLLEEGIAARRQLIEVEMKKRYPLFFVGVIGTAAYAGNRDRLENPFVIDPLNHLAIGPVLGFKYSLDFGIAAGRIKEAEAEVQKLEALRDFARDSIPLQVRDAYGAVLEARRNVEIFARAHDVAKKMLIVASSNTDLGIGEPRDLADGLSAYARTRAEYLQALFAHVYGLEQLAHVVGLDTEEVRRLAPPAAGRPGAVTIIRPGGSG